MVDAELLLSLAAKVADKRHTQEVLDTIVGGLAGLPGVVLAGIWLLRPGDLCKKCSLRADFRDQAQCLHLVASAGTAQSGTEESPLLQDHLRRIPLDDRKLSTGEGVLIEDAAAEWLARPDWVRSEQIRGCSAHALVSREKHLGMLVVFMHEKLQDGDSND